MSPIPGQLFRQLEHITNQTEKTRKHRYLMGEQGRAGSIAEIRSHPSLM